jgi:hypothetical protein
MVYFVPNEKDRRDVIANRVGSPMSVTGQLSP